MPHSPDPSSLFYHATRAQFETLSTKATVDGGIHFGTQAQAQMRGGAKGRLIAARLDIAHPRRSRDVGGAWRGKIRAARAVGFDAIVYLNRYEGVPLERIQAASDAGVNLDALTDVQFRRWVPEATDSWIVFSADQVRVCAAAPPPPASSPPRPR